MTCPPVQSKSNSGLGEQFCFSSGSEIRNRESREWPNPSSV